MSFSQEFANQLPGSIVEIGKEDADDCVRGLVIGVTLTDETFTIEFTGPPQEQYAPGDETTVETTTLVRNNRVYYPSYTPTCFTLIGMQEERILFFPPRGKEYKIFDRSLPRV